MYVTNICLSLAVADATGKIPSGILDGTVMDFGSYDECLRIKVVDSSKYSEGEEQFRGQFCMVGFDSPLISPMTQRTKDGKSYLDTYGPPPEWVCMKKYILPTVLYEGHNNYLPCFRFAGTRCYYPGWWLPEADSFLVWRMRAFNLHRR